MPLSGCRRYPTWLDRSGTGIRTSNPRVSIIVPARNEEENIEPALRQLLELDYQNYEVIVVDDRSTDQTGEIIDRIATGPKAHGRLKVIHIDTLPSGWLGKTHAMWTATQEASGDWLLFTDADVLFQAAVFAASLGLRRGRTSRPSGAFSSHDHEAPRRKE